MSKKGKDNGKKDIRECFDNILKGVVGTELMRKLLGGYYSQAVVDTVEDVSWLRQKSYLEVKFTTEHSALRINVKTFKAEGTPNHLERRNHSDFCRRNQVRKKDIRFLQKIWLRKAAGDRRQPLVDSSTERSRIIKIFSSIEPGVSALCGYDHPQVLALYNGRQGCWHIYDMACQVLPLVRAKQISFSPGGNIDIGRYIMLQRRGAEGGRGSSDKNIEHRSNDVQVKMRVEKFYNEVKPLCKCRCKNS